MTTEPRAPIVIIGIGSALRRDDGLGLATIDALSEAPPAGRVEALSLDGEPTRLLDAWQGRRLAIVVDAIVSNTPPGTVHRVAIGTDEIPFGSATSSHGPGLSEAIALARVLGREPERLIVYGVEPSDLGRGPGLSPPVAAAVPRLLERIHDEVRDATPGQ